MSKIIVSDYGTWKSPVSSAATTASSVSLVGLQIDGNKNKQDTVYWAECRFEEGGRYAICSRTIGGESNLDVTPPDFNARTKVHEYGGGSFIIQDGVIYASEFKDQALYKIIDKKSTAVTSSENNQRFADGNFSTKYNRIYLVCENHDVVKSQDAKEAKNYIVSVNPNNGKISILTEGADFYSSPQVSSDGKIAWIQWYHPNMPWDSTEMWTAQLDESGDAILPGTEKKIFASEGSAAMHPRWTHSGDLLYLSDQSGWWNLWRMTPDGNHSNVRPMLAELGGPHWTFAWNYYWVDPSNSTQVVVCFPEEGLGLLDYTSGEFKKIETGFDNHSHVQFSLDGHIYCIAGSPTRFPAVIRVNIQTNKVDVIRESKQVTLNSENFSIPEKISWPTTDGKKAYGYLYKPKNPNYMAPEGSLPPLLVKAHGGPTAHAFNDLNMEKQYFTSRGFAVLDVDYRGSTGHGKVYKNELQGNWGLCDVQDCSNGAKYLAEQGIVDGKKLCIDGGSAGGYTTLACLAFTDVFSAGASHYGVADCSLLAAETHKFESRYLDGLIAPYNKENEHVYFERSPINHIDKFNCAIVFFQGDEDEIVPPSQSELMYNKLKEHGHPTAYKLFKGEQHGFRKAENKQYALDGEFYFFSQVFGFQPADKDKGKLDIVNLPK